MFRKYEINYFYIFDLDYRYKLYEYQIWAIAIVLAFFWFVAFYADIICLIIEAYADVDHKELLMDHIRSYNYIGMTLLSIFIVGCFFPHKCMYGQARIELAYTIYNILISPFGKVRFKDFFFADVLTSIT